MANRFISHVPVMWWVPNIYISTDMTTFYLTDCVGSDQHRVSSCQISVIVILCVSSGQGGVASCYFWSGRRNVILFSAMFYRIISGQVGIV